MDLGASNGVTFSNTRALARLKWSGVCVEASPRAFVALQDLYLYSPAVDVVCAAVMPSSQGCVKFHDTEDVLGTVVERHRILWAGNGVKFNPIHIGVVTILDLAAVFGTQWDFLNIDLEGVTHQVLRTVPLRRYGVKLVCVEHADTSTEQAATTKYLTERKYHKIKRTENNELWGL